MATLVPSTADIVEPTDTAELAASSSQPKEEVHTLTSQVLLYSFAAAVLLAIGGFVVVAVYLFRYLNHAFSAFDTNSMTQLSGMDPGRMQTILLARAGLWKFILQSCGIISGVAFGFLGFGLFLLGAKGDMDAAFDDSQHKVQLSRMAPGSFVILIAAILIGICSTKKVELSFDPVKTATEISGGGQGGGIRDAIPNLDNIPPVDAPVDAPQPGASKPAPSTTSPGKSDK